MSHHDDHHETVTAGESPAEAYRQGYQDADGPDPLYVGDEEPGPVGARADQTVEEARGEHDADHDGVPDAVDQTDGPDYPYGTPADRTDENADVNDSADGSDATHASDGDDRTDENAESVADGDDRADAVADDTGDATDGPTDATDGPTDVDWNSDRPAGDDPADDLAADSTDSTDTDSAADTDPEESAVAYSDTTDSADRDLTDEQVDGVEPVTSPVASAVPVTDDVITDPAETTPTAVAVVPVPASTDAPDTPADKPAATDSDKLLDESVGSSFTERWREVQSSFVDDPAAAVRDAGSLVDEIVTAITASLKDQRSGLAETDGGGDGSETEQLRRSLMRHRALAQRLLDL